MAPRAVPALNVETVWLGAGSAGAVSNTANKPAFNFKARIIILGTRSMIDARLKPSRSTQPVVAAQFVAGAVPAVGGWPPDRGQDWPTDGGDLALRAVDAAIGSEVHAALPRRVNGTPTTYRASGGRLCVVVPTGGGEGASLVAFALGGLR